MQTTYQSFVIWRYTNISLHNQRVSSLQKNTSKPHMEILSNEWFTKPIYNERRIQNNSSQLQCTVTYVIDVLMSGLHFY